MMNERIRLLAGQAEMAANKGDHVDVKIMMEKFAKLLVQECVGVCLDRHHTWKWDNELDSDSGPRDCARSIKEHFGIE